MTGVTIRSLKAALEHVYVQKKVDYMVYTVEGATTKPEVVIHPRENFAEKVAYMEKAYTEFLVLKANPNIKIGQVEFVPARLLPDILDKMLKG